MTKFKIIDWKVISVTHLIERVQHIKDTYNSITKRWTTQKKKVGKAQDKKQNSH